MQVGIEVDKNKKELRHVDDVVDKPVLEEVINSLIDMGKITLPYSVYTCIRHIENFRVDGDFFCK